LADAAPAIPMGVPAADEQHRLHSDMTRSVDSRRRKAGCAEQNRNSISFKPNFKRSAVQVMRTENSKSGDKTWKIWS
jgi:hypothetical protein